MRRSLFIILLHALALDAAAQRPDFASLKISGHPRLLLTEERLREIVKLRESDPDLKLLSENLLAACDRMLSEPPEEFALDRGNLLPTARAMSGRMVNLALAHRLTGKAEYRDRAVKEAAAAAAFETWLPDPYHFLDPAEMTFGFAIVRDWLDSTLTEAERSMLRTAMVERTLKPAAAKYERGDGFVVASNNWNQVCNGGFAAGAIALLDEEKELAEGILAAAVKSAEHAKTAFAPDGVCVEGIGYWGYANVYGGILYDSLATAFGSDFGLSGGPGLDRSAIFADAILPNGTGDLEGFNFGDVGGISRWYAGGPAWNWHARRFGHDAFLDGNASKQSRAATGLADGRPDAGIAQLHALNLVWFVPHRGRNDGEPLDSLFRGPVPVVTMRSSRADPDAAQVFAKGGDNAASHGHLDPAGRASFLGSRFPACP